VPLELPYDPVELDDVQLGVTRLSMTRLLRADVWCGAMFMAFAAWGFAASAGLDGGTAVSMGPGYFPRLVSTLLLLLGLSISIAGLWPAKAAGLGTWTLRPILLVSLASLAFAVLLQRAGIVLSIVAVVAIGALAGSRIEPWPLVGLTVLLVASSIALFVVALGIPLPIWPRILW